MSAKQITRFYIGADWYADFTQYVTNTGLTTKLGEYPTKTELNNTLGSYVTTTSLNNTLSSYTTTQSLATTLANYASRDYVNTTFTTKTDLNATLGSYATKNDLNTAIASITKLTIQIVASLPATGTENIIYLVPNHGAGGNVKDEYLWVDGKWELIGTTAVDLSNYPTIGSMNTAITNSVNNKAAELTGAYQTADTVTLNSAKTYADTKLKRIDLAQAAWDALPVKDPNGFYVVAG